MVSLPQGFTLLDPLDMDDLAKPIAVAINEASSGADLLGTLIESY